MAIFPKRPSITEAWRDLRDFVVAPRPHKIVFLAAALAAPVGLFEAFLQQAKVDTDYIPPAIIYVKQWDANRSVEDVKRQQAIDLPGELAAKKAREAEAEATRQAYRRVADQFGIDVDKKRR